MIRIEFDDNIRVRFYYTSKESHNPDVNKLYNIQRRREILKRRDVGEYSRTLFIEQNRIRWETFIHLNLKKSKLRLLTADVKDQISIWTENAAKITKYFFKLKSGFEPCMCCHQIKSLTRAHLIHDRPELLKRAILEAPIIDDGHECHISSQWFMRRYIELHTEFPIAPLCKECHEYIDRKTST